MGDLEPSRVQGPATGPLSGPAAGTTLALRRQQACARLGSSQNIVTALLFSASTAYMGRSMTSVIWASETHRQLTPPPQSTVRTNPINSGLQGGFDVASSAGKKCRHAVQGCLASIPSPRHYTRTLLQMTAEDLPRTASTSLTRKNVGRRGL